MISFFVAGEPAPKGSTRSFYTGGKVITTNANRRTKDWEMRIATEAQMMLYNALHRPVDLGPGWVPTNKAVWVVARFLLKRPKSLPKKVIHDIKRPDLDKLIRAVLDGITGILIEDDSQIVHIIATKQYAQPNEQHGVLIELEEIL